MKKKYLIAGISCMFIVISGFCYSCAQSSNGTVLLKAGSHEKEDVDTPTEEGKKDKAAEIAPIATREKEAENAASEAPKKEKSAGVAPDDPKYEQADGMTDKSVSDNRQYVHICGAVVEPGVYEVDADARLINVVRQAGGLTKEAAGDYMNLAMTVSDGQRIYIPTRAEVSELTPEEYAKGDISAEQYAKGGINSEFPKGDFSSDEELKQELPININTAGAAELMELPGIGQAKADSIILYRTENGSFLETEELMNIPGIKEGLYQKLEGLITVQ